MKNGAQKEIHVNADGGASWRNYGCPIDILHSDSIFFAFRLANILQVMTNKARGFVS